MKYIATVDGQEYKIDILDEHRVAVNGKVYGIDFEPVSDQPVYSLLFDGKSFEGLVYARDDAWQVLLQGTLYTIHVEDERDRRLRSTAGGGVIQRREYHLKAPMPGLVVAVPVKVGQQVKEGEVLLILESMKMQNELKSPRPGTVTRVRVRPGDSVSQKETLVTVE